jgi:hypothetical protein
MGVPIARLRDLLKEVQSHLTIVWTGQNLNNSILAISTCVMTTWIIQSNSCDVGILDEASMKVPSPSLLPGER